MCHTVDSDYFKRKKSPCINKWKSYRGKEHGKNNSNELPKALGRKQTVYLEEDKGRAGGEKGTIPTKKLKEEDKGLKATMKN